VEQAVAEGQIKVTRSPGCHLEAIVHVGPEVTQAAQKRAIREVSKEVSVPGFRKGRVPDALVLEHFASAVDREWRKQVNLMTWETLMRSEPIRPLRNGIHARMKSCSLQTGAEIEYKIDHEPAVPEIGLEGLHLPPAAPEPVTDEERADLLKQIGRWMGQTEPADEVVADSAVSLKLFWTDQEPQQQFAARENTPLEQLPPWMVTALMGRRAGDQVELAWGDTPVDDDQLIPQGRPCRLSLEKVEKLLDHPIDDALAQKVGAGTLEVLRERVDQRIVLQKRGALHKQRRHQLRDLLLKQVQFEVPASVVETTMASVEEPPAGATQTKDEIRTEVTDGVRLAYLAEALLRQFGQTVTYQDVLAKVQEMSPPWADHQKLLRDLLTDEQANARLTSTVMVEKALDCLIARLDAAAGDSA